MQVVLFRKPHPIRNAALHAKAAGAFHLAGHRRDSNHLDVEGPGKPDRAASHPAAGVQDSRSARYPDVGRQRGIQMVQRVGMGVRALIPVAEVDGVVR